MLLPSLLNIRLNSQSNAHLIQILILPILVRHFSTVEQPVHIDHFWFIWFGIKQLHYLGTISKPDCICLLHISSTYAPHRLQNLLLRQVQIFPNIPMTELVIGPIDIITRRNYHKETLVVRQFFHNLCIRHAIMGHQNSDPHHQQHFQTVIYTI